MFFLECSEKIQYSEQTVCFVQVQIVARAENCKHRLVDIREHFPDRSWLNHSRALRRFVEQIVAAMC